MLVGLCLPFFAVHFGPNASASLGVLDVVGIAAATAGVCLGHAADTQLRDFMVANHVRQVDGKPKVRGRHRE